MYAEFGIAVCSAVLCSTWAALWSTRHSVEMTNWDSWQVTTVAWVKNPRECAKPICNLNLSPATSAKFDFLSRRCTCFLSNDVELQLFHLTVQSKQSIFIYKGKHLIYLSQPVSSKIHPIAQLQNWKISRNNCKSRTLENNEYNNREVKLIWIFIT